MKMKNRLTAAVLAAALVFLTAMSSSASAPAGDSPLRFNAEGKFTIMVATDTHQHYFDDSDIERSTKTADMQALLRAAIERAQPDLVIFNGDNAFGATTQEMRVSIARIVAPVVEKGIPFTAVFGNHDTENGITLEEQLALYNEHPNCLMADPVPALSGCGTHNLLIRSSDGTRYVFNLWMMDSGSYSKDPAYSGYDWVKDEQIARYEQTGNALRAYNGGEMMPSLLFQHIPVPEMYELLRRPKLLELPDSVMGQVSWAKGLFVLKDDVKGTLGEGPCSPDFNNGQFQSWVTQGDVLGAFFGHDHVNDFEGYVDGIMLGYCRTAGFLAYGDRGHQAVRLITLDENNPNTFSTEMLSMKQLGLRAASVGWLDHALTERQQYKLFIGLAVVALFPTLVGTLAVIKYVLK